MKIQAAKNPDILFHFWSKQDTQSLIKDCPPEWLCTRALQWKSINVTKNK